MANKLETLDTKSNNLEINREEREVEQTFSNPLTNMNNCDRCTYDI